MNKKISRRAILLFFLFITVVLLWIWWPITPFTAWTANEHVKIYGCEPQDERCVRIREYLSFFPSSVKKSVTSITVEDDPDFYDDWDVLGQCNLFRKIYIRSETITSHPSTIWHECAHAHHFYLDTIWSKYSARWKKINGASLSWPGEDAFKEDVAIWVQSCYMAATGKKLHAEFSPLSFIARYPPKDTNAFKQKLLLLKEYEFINSEIYDKVSTAHPSLFK